MKVKYLIYDEHEDKYYSTNSYELFVLMTGYPSTFLPNRVQLVNPYECQSKATKETWKKAMEQGQHILDCGYRYKLRWVKSKYGGKWKHGYWIKEKEAE